MFSNMIPILAFLLYMEIKNISAQKIFCDLCYCYLHFRLDSRTNIYVIFFWQANLAFAAIRDRKVIGKVMIVFDDPKTVQSKL